MKFQGIKIHLGVMKKEQGKFMYNLPVKKTHNIIELFEIIHKQSQLKD
jgi:hypothetical protein